MNKGYMGAVLLAAISLAACGGGGSSNGGPIPNPGPSSTPTNYTVTLKYTGGAEPRSGLVRSVAVTSDAGGTPPPILLVAPDNSSALAQFQPASGDSQAVAQAVVNPSPSSSPSATWTGGDADVSVATLSPNTQAAVDANALNKSDATSVTANVTVNGALTQLQPKAYEYGRLTLSCSPSDQSGNTVNPSEWWNGVVFDSSGNPTQTNNPAVADIYVDGPNCYGAFNNPGESQSTLHFRFGGHLYADGYKTFDQFTAADYQGDLTSAGLGDMFSATTKSDNLTFKDGMGRVHFWFLTYAELPYGKNSGAHKVCNGTAIDGSC